MESLRWYTFVFAFARFALSAATTGNDIENHPAWSILDKFECGESVADRIIGGKSASLGQIPWIARLGYTGIFDKVEWLCGAALLSDRFVITAAHCLQDETFYNLTHVRLGEYDLSKNPDCVQSECAPPVQDLRVKKTIMHENFNKPAFQNDIALIEMAEPASLNDYVAPICLPRNVEQFAPLAVGDSMVVAGWGKTNMTTDELANILQVIQLPVLDPESCSVFKKSFKWSQTQICAGGEKDKDACAGDSGGPLTKVFDTPEGPKHFLIGVVSFGPAVCGSGNLPGIYVSVSAFEKWILNHIFASKGTGYS